MTHLPTHRRSNRRLALAMSIVALCAAFEGGAVLAGVRFEPATPQTPAAPPAQGGDPNSKPEDKTSGRPDPSKTAPHPIKVIRDFEPHRVEATKSLARVRLYYTVESRLPNGEKGPGSIIEQGVYLGIVIDALPLIAVPDTTGDPSRFSPQTVSSRPAPSKPAGFVNGVAMNGPFYDAVLKSGKRVRLVVSEHDRPVSWLVLKLEDGSDPPAELRNPLPLPAAPRRIRTNEAYVGTIFRNPLEIDTVVSVPGWIAAGSESFLRPALSGMVAGVGAPVFAVDGEWLGVVNHPPEGEPLETPRVGHVDASGVAPTQDPRIWSTGYRAPVLFSIGELIPEIERMHRAASAPHDFPELGLSISDSNGTVRVTSVAEPSSAAAVEMITPKPSVGDRVISLGGQKTNSVDGFEKALEAALTGDAKSAQIELEHAGETRIATLRFPG